MTFIDLSIVALCLALGGLLKGATGAGAPIFAIPALAAVFDVPFAIAIMVMPNLLTNTWQAWQHRSNRPDRKFLLALLGGGAAGAAFGTWVLTAVPTRTLTVGIAGVLLIYLSARIAKPHWQLSGKLAGALALPAGLVSGLLQGATGISAPTSITFLNAIRLERPVFIFTISTLFVSFVLVQFPALLMAGILTGERVGLSLLALVPILAAMPAGAALAKKLPAVAFDRLIMIFLAGLSAKLLFDAFT